MSDLLTRLRSLSPVVLAGLRRGIEKESLRVRLDGTLATTPHPRALGAALTHPHLTPDFSEAQFDFFPASNSPPPACLDELTNIHRFVYRHIVDEMLWCGSMPCN